ncbi:MAG: phytoene desaturase family protein [Bacteroidota bacterium]|nr:phytoene desaturase family protein [Bacteroidota bacterium]
MQAAAKFPRVVVIGGGFGGLSAAIYLARSGAEVVLLEQQKQLGGKASERRLGPYRFDTGPSVLTLPGVLEGVLAAAGRHLETVLELVPLEPICRYSFSDGSVLEVSADPDRMRARLLKWAPEEADRWKRFLAYSRGLYERAAPVFLFFPVHELGLLVRSRLFWRSLPGLLGLDAFRSMHARARRLFGDWRLVQLADRFATYNGSDPFRAPATLHVIFWVEHGLGAYYVRGGIYRIVEALADAASALGVQLRLGEPARCIRHEAGRITGVETDSGFWAADAVVCNVDVSTTYRTLLGGEYARYAPRGEPSLSGLVFLWGVRGRTELAHHNVLFSADYEREFRELFREGRPPEDPTVYVAITARSDPEHAPSDGENWFVLLNMPARPELWHSERSVDRIRSLLMSRLEERVRGFSADRIEAEAVLTPADLERLTGAYRGSLYGLASNSPWAAFRRPANRSRHLRGLYFAGGSAHPGGGIPLALLSGRHAAWLAARDLGLSWRVPETGV